ncbi:RDD domain-containing protein [Mycolicibacterium novocastrense]|uniref:RDD domain-containing protein n=1 Tax=Mycolicibacterium novocastrense TaxID=59813 RepID=A0ABQ0KGN3_MYCNV|nr:RDD domain-containing protein [Mycolicibacterium novocastrense]
MAVDEPAAPWSARVGAFAVDVLVGLAVVSTLALVSLTAPLRSPLWWGYLVAIGVVVLAMAVNRLVLPTVVGFSLGRAVFGIAVRKRDGSPPGVWRLLLRDVAHLLDTAALFIGWLWPLWDRRRRTFADLLLRTEVRPVPPPERNVRKLTAVVLIAATVACAAAVAVNYWVVYRHERAVEQTRQQIAEQGPRIVEQMLSFKSDTMQEDFARAQSLATDGYRQQLIEQQKAGQSAGVSSNEYWAVSSAVLEATPDTAEMLLALQGQRGDNPNELKFITATVQAEFAKSGDGQWRVANLTVLKRPQMTAQGR